MVAVAVYGDPGAIDVQDEYTRTFNLLYAIWPNVNRKGTGITQVVLDAKGAAVRDTGRGRQIDVKRSGFAAV